jgi:hypothetical protein
VIVQVDVHDRLELPTMAPTGHRFDYVNVPDLQRPYNPVLERIQFLAEKGLTSILVLHDFLSKCIAPFQERARPVWLYTRENDATWLEQGRGTNLVPGVLETTLSKLSTDPSSIGFITPPVHCMPICTDQATRSLLLKVMPTLDDIDIATRRRGDQSRRLHIPRTNAANGRGGGVLTPPRAPAKGRRR